jgi:zinc transport system substrate-binding protein
MPRDPSATESAPPRAPRPRRVCPRRGPATIRPLFAILGAALAAAPAVGPAAPTGAAEAPPAVIASIAPIHSLVAQVMEGAGRPRLLLPRGASPHGFALRPSDARALARARLIVWVGPALEGGMARPLAALAGGAVKLRLIDADGVRTLPVRRGGVWEADEHEHGHEHETAEGHGEEHHEGEHGEAAGIAAVDPHIWLDPRNAAAMLRAIAASLAAVDPARAGLYRANAERAEARLRALDSALAARLAPVRRVPFVVFHDAYQYLERRYGLAAIGAVTLDPGRTPGAKRLIELKARIRRSGAACAFAEPQFEPGLLATVIEGTGARAATLDPLGAALEPGPGQYATLMDNLAAALAGCLARR